MRHQRISTLCFLLATVLQASADKVDDVVAGEMKNRGISGVSIAVVDKGAISLAKAYGFTEKDGTTAVTTDTLFQAGSISKAVSALGALRLVEQKKLSLDDDVNASLKQWKLPESDFTKEQKVTLRRILSHSAGLTVHGFPGYDAESPVPTLVQVLNGTTPANTQPIRVDTIPGSAWRYSGGGYAVMQQLMVEAGGKEFPALMKELVLAPLKMDASGYDQPLPEKLRSLAASGYEAGGKAVPGKWHVYPEMAAAGLWTTPSDLARFVIGIHEAFIAKSEPVISSAMAKQMLTVQKGASGLGIFVGGNPDSPRFLHGGRDAGFDAHLIGNARSGNGVVVMINANEDTGSIDRIINAVKEKYGWLDKGPLAQ